MSGIERLDGTVARVALLGVEATRKIERGALARLPAFTLMTRAGEAVARLAVAVAPHARRIVVFAGPGNNGGDGFEAATRLWQWGKRVTVIRVGASARAVPDDAANALARAVAAGVEITAFDPASAPEGDGPDLIIDALLGIGASRPPEGDIAAAIARIAELAALGARVLSVDVPSGLDAERGQPLGAACVVADDTLTLITAKPGLFTGSGRDHAGRTWKARIDVDVDPKVGDAWLVGVGDPWCKEAPRRHASHKGSYGDVAVVGGAPGMAGAAWLAARAAHAAGAGRVFVDLVGADADAQGDRGEIDPTRPELMFRRGWHGSDVAAVAATTIVCGCGGGDGVRATLPRLLSIAARVVLDADALNAIAADPSLQSLAIGRQRRGHATIMTPHPLEAARLLDSTTAAVQGDRLCAARAIAARYRAVVVLKGSGTVIADGDGEVRINATGNASLASAGTGDVLAGWIGGRWATRTATAFDVATRAVIEHGAAAEPERPGPLRAADLVERLHRRSRGE